MSKAHQNNPNNQKSNSFGSAEPKQSEIAKEKVLDTGKKPKVNQFDKPVHENNEIAKLAGVSKSTVVRAKKLNVKILKLTKESSKKIVAGIRPITNCHQLKTKSIKRTSKINV